MRFKLKVIPIGGDVVFPPEAMRDVVSMYSQYVAAKPDDLCLDLVGLALFVPGVCYGVQIHARRFRSGCDTG